MIVQRWLSVALCFAAPAWAQDVKSERDQTASKTEKKEKKPPPPFQWVNPLPEEPHKSIRQASFHSPSLKVDVGYLIRLPAEYEESEERYPVVYYLHGGRPGSEVKSHKLVPLIDDVMRSGRVPPAIYVFVNGGPVSHYNMPGQPEAQGADVFINELIPHIDATYRTIANRNGRAIEGFSQGGRGTMRLSLRHPDLFCSAAAGGGGYETERKISQSGGRESATLQFAEGDNVWDLANVYAKSGHAPVRWLIYVGTEGFNYENNLAYMKFLDSIGIDYQRLIIDDVPHSALKVYEKRVFEIMQFHANNFAETDHEAR